MSATGAGQVIAIVTAYDEPSLGDDLEYFDHEYGVPTMFGTDARPCTIARGPHPCLEWVYPTGRPEYQDDWATDAALSVEWAHAIAPGADILLVEARQATFADLFVGVDRAAAVASIVAMSWGSAEWAGETALDEHFQRSGVTFLAGTGDIGAGPLYPAASPYVVAVGGTSLRLRPDGERVSETSWNGSGNGPSLFESVPAYQRALATERNGFRRTPDVVFSADPVYGYPVYNSRSPYGRHGWSRMGGTSAAVPQWAALFALAGQLHDGPKLASTNLAASPLYRLARSQSASSA
ncbi:MAG TPA: S8 family serine peptidase, partial [Chloroflexota bacterium]|nr:S8 family serine peptidase [Chloroflexota bacterium]